MASTRCGPQPRRARRSTSRWCTTARPPTEMDGTVPLVLSGHYHRREQHLLPDGTLSFFQGSTGASGLRGLEGPG